MPFKSKAQARYFAWAEEHGKLPKGTFKKWLKHTKNFKELPERTSSKKTKKKKLKKKAYKIRPSTEYEQYITKIIRGIPLTSKKIQHILNEKDANRIMRLIQNDPALKEEERKGLASGISHILKYTPRMPNHKPMFLGSLAGMTLGYYTSKHMAKKNVSPWLRKLVQVVSTLAGGVAGQYVGKNVSEMDKQSNLLEKQALWLSVPLAVLFSAAPTGLGALLHMFYRDLPTILAAGGFAAGGVTEYMSQKDREEEYAFQQKLKHVKDQVNELRADLGLENSEKFQQWAKQHNLEIPSILLGS